MARQVIVSPFLQRRNLLFRAGENIPYYGQQVGQEVAQAIFVYQQQKEQEKKTKIQALDNVAKMFGGYSKLAPEDVLEYERLTNTKLPRDPADPSRVAKTQAEETQAALGPVTHDQAMVASGLMQPAPNPLKIQADKEIAGMKAHEAAQAREDRWDLAMYRADRADQTMLKRLRLTHDIDYRHRPSGFGLDERTGKVRPWKDLEGKPNVHQMDEFEYHMSTQSKHYKNLDTQLKRKANLGIDKFIADIKQNEYVHGLLSQAVMYEKGGYSSAAKTMYTAGITASMTAEGNTPEDIQKVISDDGTLSAYIAMIKNALAGDPTAAAGSVPPAPTPPPGTKTMKLSDGTEIHVEE